MIFSIRIAGQTATYVQTSASCAAVMAQDIGRFPLNFA